MTWGKGFKGSASQVVWSAVRVPASGQRKEEAQPARGTSAGPPVHTQRPTWVLAWGAHAGRWWAGGLISLLGRGSPSLAGFCGRMCAFPLSSLNPPRDQSQPKPPVTSRGVTAQTPPHRVALSQRKSRRANVQSNDCYVSKLHGTDWREQEESTIIKFFYKHRPAPPRGSYVGHRPEVGSRYRRATRRAGVDHVTPSVASL